MPLLIGQPAGIFLVPVESYLGATQFPTDQAACVYARIAYDICNQLKE